AADVTGHDGIHARVVRVAHAQGLEEHLVQVGGPGAAGDLLDHRTGEDVAGIVVLPGRAGRETYRTVAEDGDQAGGVEVTTHIGVHVAGDVGVVLDARGVVEQLGDGDVPAAGIVGQVAAERIVERDPAFVHQPEHAGGGELLGDGADAEDMVGRQRYAKLDAGHAARAAVDHLVAARDQHGHAGAVGGDMGLQVLLDLA